MERTGHYSMKLSQEEFETFHTYENPKEIVKSLLEEFPSSYLELQGMPGSQAVYWIYKDKGIEINITKW